MDAQEPMYPPTVNAPSAYEFSKGMAVRRGAHMLLSSCLLSLMRIVITPAHEFFSMAVRRTALMLLSSCHNTAFICLYGRNLKTNEAP